MSTKSVAGRPVLRWFAFVGLVFLFVNAIVYVRLQAGVLRAFDALATEGEALLPQLFKGIMDKNSTNSEINIDEASIARPKAEATEKEAIRAPATAATAATTTASVTPTAATAGNITLEASSFEYPNSTSPFAYAFVIGGCNPDQHPSYQNYLFNILVSAKILQERGSKADVVALFQVGAKARTLKIPDADVRLLHALGVYVYYIPQQRFGQESFYRTQLDKFRILGLTQYQRILFMDGDVMPIANLDYLFELSTNGTLRENLVVQGVYEPANGGFFMLEPGHLEQANSIIQWRERTGLAQPYPYFDVVQGWGQALSEEDPWVSRDKRGTNYTFLAAFADQGLLFHYTKYARQSVSIVLRNGTVENWVAAADHNASSYTVNNVTSVKMQKLAVLPNPFAEAQARSNRIFIKGKHNRDGAPLNSIIHFTGNKKPWLGGGRPKEGVTAKTQTASTKHYWFWKLMELDQELQIGLDFDSHWSTGKQRPSLGMYPIYNHVLNASSNILPPLEREYPRSPKDYRIVIPK